MEIGCLQVETTQLRDRDSIQRWAVLLSPVAVRIQRLTLLSRQQPHLPATVDLEQAEIDAAIVATHQGKRKPGQVPSIGEVTLWIAQLGGYTDKPSGCPPGALVLGRGLKRMELLAAYFADLQRQKQETLSAQNALTTPPASGRGVCSVEDQAAINGETSPERAVSARRALRTLSLPPGRIEAISLSRSTARPSRRARLLSMHRT